eukprot:3740024-Prymnesium_polylepis.1
MARRAGWLRMAAFRGAGRIGRRSAKHWALPQLGSLCAASLGSLRVRVGVRHCRGVRRSVRCGVRRGVRCHLRRRLARPVRMPVWNIGRSLPECRLMLHGERQASTRRAAWSLGVTTARSG